MSYPRELDFGFLNLFSTASERLPRTSYAGPGTYLYIVACADGAASFPCTTRWSSVC